MNHIDDFERFADAIHKNKRFSVTLGYVLLILIALTGILTILLILINEYGWRLWCSLLFIVILIVASFINSGLNGKLESRYVEFFSNIDNRKKQNESKLNESKML